jgi:tetratricopeptide (TPR) repeat protein
LTSGAKVVLSTVAVNLKDCPPFGTLLPADLTPADRAAYAQFCQTGAAAAAQGRFAVAQADFQRATELCPEAAEAQFQLAACLGQLTNGAAARDHFEKAVDADTLPFRADSRINERIRTAAHKFAGDSLVLCDAVTALSAASPEGNPGAEFFYEHVHLNPAGNYALARAWAESVAGLLPLACKREARPDWAAQAECEQLLGLTDWNRVSILEEVLRRLQRPPFSGQSGHAPQVARLQREIDSVRQRLNVAAAPQAREVYQRALRRAPEDYRLHENYAEFLEALREWPAAISAREKVCALLPHSYFPRYALGVDLKDAGALAEARAALLQAAALKPDDVDILLELGIVSARQANWEVARQHLAAARRIGPTDPRVPLYLGEVLGKLGLRDEAAASLREAIRLAPADWQAHHRLASNFAQEGRLLDAATEYQEALRLNPASVKTKLGLTTVLLSLQREPEAIQQLNAVLAQEPNNSAALELRRKVRGW